MRPTRIAFVLLALGGGACDTGILDPLEADGCPAASLPSPVPPPVDSPRAAGTAPTPGPRPVPGPVGTPVRICRPG